MSSEPLQRDAVSSSSDLDVIAPSPRHLRLVDLHIDADNDVADHLPPATRHPSPTPLDMLLDRWSTWMRAGSLSARTVHSRTNLVRLLATRTEADPVTCSWEPLAAFLTALPSAATRVTYQADLRAWFNWLVLMGVRPDNPALLLRKAKRPRRKPRPLTLDQLAQLLSTRMHHRTRVAILLETYEGFRAAEVATTRGEYLRVRPGWIRVLGKGGTDELVPLHPIVAEVVDTMPAIGWWFPSNSTRPGQHAHANSISAMISKAMDRAGIHGVGHQLRHTFGTQTMRQNGGNIRQTQQLMRHANIASTAIYTEVADDEMVETINRLPVPLHVRR